MLEFDNGQKLMNDLWEATACQSRAAGFSEARRISAPKVRRRFSTTTGGRFTVITCAAKPCSSAERP